MHAPGRPPARDRDEGRAEDPLPDARRPRARGRAHEPALGQFPRREDRRRARADGRARGQLPHGLRRQRHARSSPRTCSNSSARRCRARRRCSPTSRACRPTSCAAAVAALAAMPRRGDFAGVRELGIPDLAWVQPGANRVAGAHAGKSMGAFAGRMRTRSRRAALHRVRHAGVQSRRRARARRRSSRGATATRWSRRARCCSRGTAASCSRRAGSPTTSSSRTRSSASRSRRRAARRALEQAFEAAAAAVARR